jgi:hypothetical protein
MGLSLSVSLAVSACKGKPEPAAEPPPPPASCATASDCPEHWVCLGGRCTDPSSTAIYSDPSNAVTPDKVEREVEQAGQKHEQDVDRAVEEAEK